MGGSSGFIGLPRTHTSRGGHLVLFLPPTSFLVRAVGVGRCLSEHGVCVFTPLLCIQKSQGNVWFI